MHMYVVYCLLIQEQYVRDCTLREGQVVHQHIQTFILLIQELLSPAERENERERGREEHNEKVSE